MMNGAYFDNPNLQLIWKYMFLPFGSYYFIIFCLYSWKADALIGPDS